MIESLLVPAAPALALEALEHHALGPGRSLKDEALQRHREQVILAHINPIPQGIGCRPLPLVQCNGITRDGLRCRQSLRRPYGTDFPTCYAHQDQGYNTWYKLCCKNYWCQWYVLVKGRANALEAALHRPPCKKCAKPKATKPSTVASELTKGAATELAVDMLLYFQEQLPGYLARVPSTSQ